METRKLQKIGGSTYSVSLPKEWATEHHLEAGMPIHLYPHTDGSLVVRSAAQDDGPLAETTVQLPTADVDAAEQNSPSSRSWTGDTAEQNSPSSRSWTGDTAEQNSPSSRSWTGDAAEQNSPSSRSWTGDAAERALRAAYAVGYDTITLLAPDDAEFTADERRAVRRLVQTMVGLSVTEETTDRLVVENLLDASEVSIRQSVIQLQFTACSMHRTAIERVASRDTEPDSDRLAGRDDGVDRLFEMITRHFNRSLTDFAEIDDLDVRRSELFDYYLVARQLERIADHAVRIGALASRIDPAVDDDVFAEVGALAEATCEVVETATTAVLETSAERAHEALDRRDAVVADLRALDRALFERSAPGAYALSRVLASLTRTADCGGNVARVALRTSVRPDA